jgi:hypothetical protein
VLVKILHDCVALNPNSQLLLNRAPCPDLFSYAQQDHKLNEIGIISYSARIKRLKGKALIEENGC